MNTSKTGKNAARAGNLLYLNQPVKEAEKDLIGMTAYVKNIMAAIKNGAQMVGITSDFGGGKSTLIDMLENEYDFIERLKYKFCRVNLWCQTEGDAPNAVDLHKTFLYQLTSQIRPGKGSYVSRRLSRNYGLLKISANGWLASFFTVTLAVCGVAGICIKTFQTQISDIFPELAPYLTGTSMALLALSVLLAVVLLMKADIIFSSKSSEKNREIEEIGILDLYRSMILNCGFGKHYIIVLEDLDRTEDAANVLRFMKEIRKYYVPSRAGGIFKNLKNKVTFVVNIKPEVQLKEELEAGLIAGQKGNSAQPYQFVFEKLFDYIVDLKKINIDNYDAILEGLIQEKRTEIEDAGIPVYEENNVAKMQGMQWIIRGKSLDIRGIKDRLNAALLLYQTLTLKFGLDRISFEKCAAVSYLMSAYSEEFYKMSANAFEILVEKYIEGTIESETDVQTALGCSEAYAEIIYALIKARHIDSDYRTYFYNYPKGSYLYTSEEAKVRDTILYDEEVEERFEIFASAVRKNNLPVITRAYDKVLGLGQLLPKAIFRSEELYCTALDFSADDVISAFEIYASFEDTGKFAITNLLQGLLSMDAQRQHYNAQIAERYCDAIEDNASQGVLLHIRKMLCTKFSDEILWYKSLFFSTNALIQPEEIKILKKLDVIMALVNLKSETFGIDTIEELDALLESADEAPVEQMAAFYVDAMDDIVEVAPDKMVLASIRLMKKGNCIIPKLEAAIVPYITAATEGEYTKLINELEVTSIPQCTLDNVERLSIGEGLNEAVCQVLYTNGLYKNYFLNMAAMRIEKIDFADQNIRILLQELNQTMLENEDALWHETRRQIATQYQNEVIKYRFMFDRMCPLIERDELFAITAIGDAISLICTHLVTKEHLKMLAEYFNQRSLQSTDTFSVLQFVSKIGNAAGEPLAEELFYLLDMKKVNYQRMSAARRKEVQAQLADALKLTEPQEMIRFMYHVGCLDSSMDIKLNSAIKNEVDTELEGKYVGLINKLETATSTTILNLLSMKYYYGFCSQIAEKFFERKQYPRYVYATVLYENKFEICEERKQTLWATYLMIMQNENPKKTQKCMAENKEFMKELMHTKAYVGWPEKSRNLFVGIYQDAACLENAITYGEPFAEAYLSSIAGFENRDAAEKFVELMRQTPVLAASKSIYSHTYRMLEDGGLKGWYTKIYKSAAK